MAKTSRNFVFSETLSFDSMVRPEDGLKRSTGPRRIQTDLSFEFGGSSPFSPSPADILFTNGLLQPLAAPLQDTKTRGTRKESGRRESYPSSKKESSATSNNRNRSMSISCPTNRGYGRRPSNVGNLPANSGKVVPKEEAIKSWNHFADAVPSLASAASRKGARRARVGEVQSKDCRSKKEVEKPRGFFGSFILACKECHTINPQKNPEKKA